MGPMSVPCWLARDSTSHVTVEASVLFRRREIINPALMSGVFKEGVRPGVFHVRYWSHPSRRTRQSSSEAARSERRRAQAARSSSFSAVIVVVLVVVLVCWVCSPGRRRQSGPISCFARLASGPVWTWGRCVCVVTLPHFLLRRRARVHSSGNAPLRLVAAFEFCLVRMRCQMFPLLY